MDLEKAFDRVPRDVLWWALRQSGVDEWIVRVIQSMYEGALTSMKLGVGESVEFADKVGVHQGSYCHRYYHTRTRSTFKEIQDWITMGTVLC